MLAGLRLRWQSRPSLVDRVLAQAPHEPVLPPVAGLVRVACVQMSLQTIDDPALWVEQCMALTQAAVRAGAQVLVFPALAVWGLVNCLGDATLGRAFFAADMAAPTAKHWAAYGRLYPALHRIYHRTFSQLAHRYHVTMAVGGLPAPRRSTVTLVANVFTPDGRLRLRQPAIVPGRLIETPELLYVPIDGYRMTAVIGERTSSTWLGPAALVADVDLIVVLPPSGATSGDRSAAGLAAASGLYVVQSSLVGGSEAPGLHGVTGIYAPPELSDTGTGILREAASDQAEEVIVATLDLARRRKRPDAS
jgi:predicted amidohydrolase